MLLSRVGIDPKTNMSVELNRDLINTPRYIQKADLFTKVQRQFYTDEIGRVQGGMAVDRQLHRERIIFSINCI